MKIFLLAFFVIWSLAGCSNSKNTFDCSPARGIGCESVSKVNELINKENLDVFIAEQNCKNCKKPNKKPQSAPIVIHFEKYVDDTGVVHSPHDVVLK